jgi:predicted RNA-binding protein
LLLVTTPPHKPFDGSEEYRRLHRYLVNELREALEKLHICFYAAPYGVIPVELCETYPLSQYEISEPFDIETLNHTAAAVDSYINGSGYTAVYLYRGREELDDVVESYLMDTCEETRMNLITIWNNDPWCEDAFTTLANTLKTH